jgi:hypothetical protein
MPADAGMTAVKEYENGHLEYNAGKDRGLYRGKSARIIRKKKF